MKKRTSAPYNSTRVVSQDGELLFITHRRRALFYVKKGLGNLINDNTVMLNFQPSTPRWMADEYSLLEKKNMCVCCGCTNLNTLTKHHIVPRCYRRHTPEYYKHDFHDVVVICNPCHEEYEKSATILKIELGDRYGASIHPTGKDRLQRLAHSILHHGSKMPKQKIMSTIQEIKSITGKKSISQLELHQMSNRRMSDSKLHGKIVIENIMKSDSLQEFVQMWRQHFIEHARPRFMPELWNVYRSVKIFLKNKLTH